MKGFYLYPVKNGGRAYWMVEYGEKVGRGKWKRRQNMFADRGRAEEFLERVKREVMSKGRIELERIERCMGMRCERRQW